MEVSEKIPKTSFPDSGPWVDLFVLDNIPNDEHLRKRYFKQLKFIDNVLMIFIFTQRNPKASGIKESVKGTG